MHHSSTSEQVKWEPIYPKIIGKKQSLSPRLLACVVTSGTFYGQTQTSAYREHIQTWTRGPKDLDSSMPFPPLPLHLPTAGMLSLRICSPSLGSAWFSMESLKAPLQNQFPFCLGTDRASPVVNSAASVHPQTQLLKGFWGPRIWPSNNSLRLYSQVCEQLAPPLNQTLHWLAVLMIG